MPDATEFLAGFGFTTGAQFDGYILRHASATHETIKRYREYYYAITLEFMNTGSGTYDNLYQAVHAKISQQPIIYGIRNPYRCIIDSPQYGDIMQTPDGVITWQLTGHSYRV